jgi:hypothetical protein
MIVEEEERAVIKRKRCTKKHGRLNTIGCKYERRN